MAFTQILLAFDGSEPAKNACNYAIDLAIRCNAGIHVVHCYQDIPATIGGQAREDLTKEAVAAAEAVIAEPCRMIKASGLTCRNHVVHGDPAQQILKTAQENRCDTIVMGTRGLGCLETMMVGSVSQDVLRSSPVPVLLTH